VNAQIDFIPNSPPHMRALWSCSTANTQANSTLFWNSNLFGGRAMRLNLGSFGHSFTYKGKRLQLLGPGTIKTD